MPHAWGWGLGRIFRSTCMMQRIICFPASLMQILSHPPLSIYLCTSPDNLKSSSSEDRRRERHDDDEVVRRDRHRCDVRCAVIRLHADGDVVRKLKYNGKICSSNFFPCLGSRWPTAQTAEWGASGPCQWRYGFATCRPHFARELEVNRVVLYYWENLGWTKGFLNDNQLEISL